MWYCMIEWQPFFGLMIIFLLSVLTSYTQAKLEPKHGENMQHLKEFQTYT